MIDWLYNYYPSPILIDFGLFRVYWYGLLMVLAIIVCLTLVIYLARIKNIIDPHLGDLFFYLIIFGLIGARLYHVVFYNPTYFFSQPLEILKVWQGGLAIHGAIIGGILTVVYYAKKYQLNLLIYLDLLAVVLPLGQAIGRWGNYFNQELFGPPCDYQWCIPIKIDNRPNGFTDFSRFQPAFLYEFFLNLLLFLVLIVFFRSKKWSPGEAAIYYLIGYSIIRFFLEFVRIDTVQLYLGFKLVQWLCLLIILSSTYYYWRHLNKKR